MIKLLKYHLKKKWVVLVVLSFAALLITLLVNSSHSYTHSYWVDMDLNVQKEEAVNPPIMTPTVIAAILATIIPFFEFSFKMKKINIDQYYSLPIKREKLYLANYLFGLIEIMTPVTISYLLGIISIFTKPSMFINIYFLPYYFILLLITTLLYSIITFVYTRNNTFIDGLVNVIMIAFSLCVLVASLNSISDAFTLDKNFSRLFEPSWYIIYSPHTYLSGMFEDLLCKGFLSGYVDDIGMIILSLSIFIPVGILSFVLFYMLSKREKAENCLQITKSWISYRLMIPLYIVTTTILLRSTNIFAILLISVAGFFLNVLHQRTFKLKLKPVITFIVCCVVSIIFAIVLEEVDQHNKYIIFDTIIRGLTL